MLHIHNLDLFCQFGTPGLFKNQKVARSLNRTRCSVTSLLWQTTKISGLSLWPTHERLLDLWRPLLIRSLTARRCVRLLINQALCVSRGGGRPCCPRHIKPTHTKLPLTSTQCMALCTTAPPHCIALCSYIVITVYEILMVG